MYQTITSVISTPSTYHALKVYNSYFLIHMINIHDSRAQLNNSSFPGNDFCHTLHIMDSTGASVVVNKKCANSSECWSLGVGCLKVDTQTVKYCLWHTKCNGILISIKLKL